MADEETLVAQEESEPLDAPARGSAEELLDAGASDLLGRMRHSTAHVMAEAIMRDRKSTRLNSSHSQQSRMPSSA